MWGEKKSELMKNKPANGNVQNREAPRQNLIFRSSMKHKNNCNRQKH